MDMNKATCSRSKIITLSLNFLHILRSFCSVNYLYIFFPSFFYLLLLLVVILLLCCKLKLFAPFIYDLVLCICENCISDVVATQISFFLIMDFWYFIIIRRQNDVHTCTAQRWSYCIIY